MKKLALLLFALFSTQVQAGVTCSLPFNLQNGTTADATQVMANYNALVACLANAAAAGVNNDITALTALTTPLTPAQGGTPVYVGGTSTGSGNSQTISSVTPSAFGLVAGNQVTFKAGFSNSGPTQINVGGTGLTNIYRRSQLGVSAMVGGEIVTGQIVTAEYDGTQFQIVSTGIDYIGSGKDWFGTTAPPGWAFIDGSCQLRAGVFADLFSVIGTTYDPTGSTCDVAHFAMPDGRGRMLAGRDDMGGSAANRITNAGSSCVGTTLGGAGCGTQNKAILQANLPNINFTVTDPGHVHTLSPSVYVQAGGPQFPGGAGSNFTTSSATASATTGISVASGGSGTALTTLNPLQIVNKIIKY